MKSYLFPGQGAQKKGMGEGLFDAFPQLVEEADEVLGYSIRSLCLDNEDGLLNQTRYTQPALYVVNALSYQQQIDQTGILPDFVAGHSLGEYNALQAAGAISFGGGLKLVKKRGELMSQAGNGAMAAILGIPSAAVSEGLLSHDLNTIDIANYNCATQTVISGLPEDLQKARLVFDSEDAMYVAINTSGAFHSRYMAPAKAEFETYLRQFTFSELNLPVISNVYAEPYKQDTIAQYLAEQITSPVKWEQSMCYLLDQGEMAFLELGIGHTLTKLIKKIRKSHAPQSTSSRPAIEASMEKINHWNNTYTVGEKVLVDGYAGELETYTAAMMLFGRKAVVYLKGYRGYFELSDVCAVCEG